MDGTLDRASRSIPNDYGELSASPVFEGRFARIDGIDFDGSAAGVAERKHAWADHQMHDDWAARTLDFLEAQTTYSPPPARVLSLSPLGMAMLGSLLGLAGWGRLPRMADTRPAGVRIRF